MARSLNRAQLIGNIVKDVIAKDASSGSKYVLFTIATNRSWKTDNGEKHEESEFHRIICWDKLAEIIEQFGQKGKKVYIEGRIATHKFTDKDGIERSSTEIIASDVIFLDKKGGDKDE